MRKAGLGTAPTLNRSTWSEAKTASAARPARVFSDVGGKYGKGLRPQGGGGILFPRIKRETALTGRLVYGVVNLYLTFLEDLTDLYFIGNQLDME